MNDILFTPMAALLATVAYGIAVFYVFVYTQYLRGHRNHLFMKALQRGIQTGVVETLEDVVNIYRGATDKSAEDLDSRSGLSQLLREYLVQNVEKTSQGTGSVEHTKNNKILITKFIQGNERQAPYADLPSHERSIISDINTFLDHKDTDQARRKIDELGSAIQARTDDMERIQSLNRWSVPLAVVGLALTVFFGWGTLQ